MSERVYPIWKHTLAYNFLRDTGVFPELKTLGGFWLARGGPADSFLFTDPDDSVVRNEFIGLGGAGRTVFQLLRTWGAYIEPVFYPNHISGVFVNGQPVAYTRGLLGQITLSKRPAPGQLVTWSGAYFFRSRFGSDTASFEKFLHQVWKSGKVELVGSLQDKVA